MRFGHHARRVGFTAVATAQRALLQIVDQPPLVLAEIHLQALRVEVNARALGGHVEHDVGAPDALQAAGLLERGQREQRAMSEAARSIGVANPLRLQDADGLNAAEGERGEHRAVARALQRDVIAVWCLGQIARFQHLNRRAVEREPYARPIHVARLTLLRRAGRDEPLDEDAELEGPAGEEPERRAAEAEAARHIQQVLMGMRPADRAVIALRHFSDCSYDEMAQILGIDVKTVKSRLFEARQRMRTLLADLRPSEGATAP